MYETMTPSPAKRMSAALKSVLVPALTALGFSGRFPRYRREQGRGIDFLAVFYNQAGTRFFLEFGTHPAGDKLTSWGEVVPEASLLLEHVDFMARARLHAQPGEGSLESNWFAFGELSAVAAFEAVAAAVVAGLPEVDAWLASGVVGPHLETKR